jgi:hypothetical protein
MGSLRMSVPSRWAATREIIAGRPSFETPAFGGLLRMRSVDGRCHLLDLIGVMESIR